MEEGGMRRLLMGVVVTTVATLGLGGAMAGPAWANTTCANTTLSGPIYDNVVVPAGTSCELTNATVYGNVVVNPGANLRLGPLNGGAGSSTDTIYGSILSNPTMGSFNSFGTATVYGSVSLNG